ncbi:MAG: hypothetical protein KatS3mg108_2952 [Isosphaeraceae bacterium]|jgi:cytochrome c oxidase subunit 4|nr:MAG: hypothetical protein KatS3mg108_2952 [Isosphaeraceae bacterium]
MAVTYATHEEQEAAEAHAPYIKVWVVLLVLTVLEYFYAKLMAGNMTALVLGLLILAGIKAALVALYFMHVKFEGRWVYAIMVPAGILAAILVLALMPDIGTAPENPDVEETVWSAPNAPLGRDEPGVRV